MGTHMHRCAAREKTHKWLRARTSVYLCKAREADVWEVQPQTGAGEGGA